MTKIPSIYLLLANYIEQSAVLLSQLLKELKKKVTDDNVHEVRVAIRRLDACLELLNALGIHNKKLSKELKELRKFHGNLRNCYVELNLLGEMSDIVNPKSFKNYLKVEKKKAQKKLIKKLQTVMPEKIHKSLVKFAAIVKLNQGDSVNHEAVIFLEEYHNNILKEFVQAKKSFNPNSPHLLHRLRILTKRLRYQREILKSTIHFEREVLGELEKFQDLLGDFRNNFMLLNSIENFLNGHTSGIKSTIKLQLYLVHVQGELIKKITEVKGVQSQKIRTRRIHETHYAHQTR